MNDTEIYLSHIRSTLHVRLAASFAAGLAVTAAAFAVTYLVFRGTDCGKYIIACDLSAGSIFGSVKNAILSQAPCAVMLAAMYLSAYSSLCRAASLVICSRRGMSLGCSVYLLSHGDVGGIGGGWKTAIYLYLAATVGFIVFSSVTAVYSAAITRTYSSGDRRCYRALSAEYTKCFLVSSGAIFILGCASAVFI